MSLNITYTLFDKVEAISEGSLSLSMAYGIDHGRVRQIIRRDGMEAERKVYLSGGCEKVTDADGSRYLTYVGGAQGLCAILVSGKDDETSTYVVLKDHLGSLHCITDAEGTLLEELSFDAWGRRRNPETWTYDNVSSTFLFDRGFTGHEHLDKFGLINMNGRIYDPVTGRFLSTDAYVQAPEFSQSHNRYSYCLNNPLCLTDPSGNTPILVAIAIGVVVNYAIQAWSGNINSVEDFFLAAGIGAASGAAGGVAGAAVSGLFSTSSSFLAGAAVGGTSGFAAGFVSGTGNALMEGQKVGNALVSGIKTGAIGGVTGALIGGVMGGLDAAYGEPNNPRNFWTGGEKAKVYRSPIGDNFGSQKGECALRCLEEFSESYGMDKYDYDYWFKQNGSKLGVKPHELQGLIDGTDVFSSDRIMSEANSIANAFSNDRRVLMGFNTEKGGAHAVMVNKVKIWSSGQYRIWFAETSPVRVAPYSTSNIKSLNGAGFWTFFPH